MFSSDLLVRFEPFWTYTLRNSALPIVNLKAQMLLVICSDCFLIWKIP